MRKYLSSLFIICFIACASTKIEFVKTNKYEELEDTIVWSQSRKLIWSDFKGVYSGSFGLDNLKKAQTTTMISMANGYYNNKNIPVINIIAYFLANDSWTITSDELALKHEQLHFDISELFARKIRKSFDSLRKKNIKDLKVYNSLFEINTKRLSKYQKKYDSDVYTMNEDNTVIFREDLQFYWISNIAKELEMLKDYE